MKLGESLERRRGRRRTSWSDRGGPRSFELGGRLALTIAGVIVGGWLIGYLVATQLLFPAPPPTGDLYEVPDVRGMGIASARERLSGARLTLGAVDSLLHPSVVEGQILGQSPLPGQLLRPDSPVRVTVSRGPQTRAVPDVTTLQVDRARTVLETSGFLVSIDTTESEVERGRVVRVFPPPDSVVPLPSQVRLLVSAGPPVVVMPFVLGLTEEEARRLLDSLGLVVQEVRPVFNFGRDRGIVIQQEPASDTELERGGGVTLGVGLGTPETGNNQPLEP